MPNKRANLIVLPSPATDDAGPEPPSFPAAQRQNTGKRQDLRYHDHEALVLRADTAERIAAIRALFLDAQSRRKAAYMERELRQAIREERRAA